MKGIVITPSNDISLIDVLENGEPLYALISAVVGGFMENVRPRRLRKGLIMIVNEEGLLHGLPVNPMASWLYETDKHGQPIVGKVIILEEGLYEGEPDIVGISDEEASAVIAELIDEFTSLVSERRIIING